VRRIIAPLTVALAAVVPSNALAAVAHTVVPGETMWTIASSSNLTTRALAAYNGLPAEGNVILGSTIQIPSPPEAAAAMAKAGLTPTNPPVAGSTTTASTSSTASTTATAPAPEPSGSAPEALGGYTVRYGDTLSGLAATAGVPLTQMAQMNGLDPDKPLLAGTVLKLPTGSPTPARAAEPAPTAIVPAAAPDPTPTVVDSGTIRSIAAEHGVPASLAAALAWQESGFNNNMVSAANARGVMQVMPGTWNWIQQNLASRTLDPHSATDNVHAGVLYLKRLLEATGGDQSAAIAGYYQGLSSVQSRGMYDDTKQYVANVQALQSRFGG
jgi:soluble lytic murein transglycosylase-like protein